MSSTKKSIPSDYVSGAPELREFYRYPLQSLDFEEVINDKSQSKIPREVLVEDLKRQYAPLSLAVDSAVAKNISSLADDRTFTVTTGHQLVLMGGPMFTLYKIATTIRMAEKLSEQHPDYRFVPIFWMATEDHDWEEVDHFWKNYCDKVEYKPGQKLSGAVGRHILDEKMGALAPEEFRDCFVPGETYSLAFRRFIHRMFADKGLVILDADSRSLKACFSEIMREELLEQPTSDAIKAKNELLAELGYKVQVTPREINLFYLGEDFRERIVETPSGFRLAERPDSWTREELLSELENHPERFSPNVTLRPLYQEVILPNLAYTGGWGELSYWLQLKGVFDHFKTNFPALIPRFSAGLLTAKQGEKAHKLGFSPEDFDQHLHRMNDQYIPQLWDNAPFLEKEQDILAAYQELSDYLEGIDPTLARSLDAQQARARKQLEKLQKKVRKSFRNKHSSVFQEIRELKEEIQPSHKVQERVLNFNYLPVDWKELLNLIYHSCEPFENFERKWIILP